MSSDTTFGIEADSMLVWFHTTPVGVGPVSMMVPPKVSRSTMAAQSLGSVKALGPAGEGLVWRDRDGRGNLAAVIRRSDRRRARSSRSAREQFGEESSVGHLLESSTHVVSRVW